MIIRTIALRLALMGFVLAGLILITFIISRLIPTDPARLIAGDYASPDVVAAIRQELGLDKPLIDQFRIYVEGLLRGDLGTSITSRRPVIDDLARFAPATIELALSAMTLSVAGGLIFGVLSAVYKDSWIDQLVRLIAMVGVSTPSFWLALLLLLFFYGQLDLFPAGGRIDPDLAALPQPTGLYMIDGALALRGDVLSSALAHLFLPSLCLALITTGGFARLIRASLLEELGRSYVRTARAIGLTRWRTVLRHALPNALTPFVTQLGLSFAGMLTGAVVTESMFGWPGMGGYILQATETLDFPAIMGFTLVVGVIYAVLNLVIDLCYLLLDPRLREEHRS